MIMFKCQEYSIMTDLHIKMIARGWWLLEIFKFDHDKAAGNLNCNSIYTKLAIAVETWIFNNTLAEALALRWCLQWILTSYQDGHFTVETDVEVVVNCLQGVSRLSAIKTIILDCSDILSKHRNCNGNFIRRSRNVVAHCLVWLARQCGSFLGGICPRTRSICCL
jgi:hypothetical protein